LLGIGVDMVEVSRIAKALARNAEKFPRRILSSDELLQFRDSPNQDSFLAKRFAVKEAVAKALGTGFANGVSWTDISLSHDELGKPLVYLKGGANDQLLRLGGSKALVSLSDEAGFVIAYAQVC
jgi:holo-[acyl-carrier protein] synthase